MRYNRVKKTTNRYVKNLLSFGMDDRLIYLEISKRLFSSNLIETMQLPQFEHFPILDTGWNHILRQFVFSGQVILH